MKKFVSLVMAIIMLMSVFSLTACSQQKDNGNQDATTQAATSQAEKTKATADVSNDPFAAYRPDPNKTYTIEWCGGHSDTPLSEDPEVLLRLEEMFNVKINYWYIERSQWDEILNLRFAAGEVPDIIRIENPMNFEKYIQQELIMPVPFEVIQEFSPNLTGMLLEYSENCFDSVSYKGETYGYPRVNVNGNYNYAPIWRIDWLKNVGINEIPKTLEECEAAFYKFRNEDPDKDGRKDTYALSNFGMDPVYGAFGALPDRFVDDGKGGLVYGAVHPGMKDALALLAKWYADELVDPEFITGEPHGGYWALSQDFIDEKIGFSSPGAFYHNNPPLSKNIKGGRNYRIFNEARGGDQENNVSEEMFGFGYNPTGPDGLHGSELWGPNGTEKVAFGKHLESEPDKLGKLLEMVEGICGNWETFFYIMTRMEWGSDEYEVTEDGAFVRKVELTEAQKERNEGSSNCFKAIETPQFVKRFDVKLYEWVDNLPQISTGGYDPKVIVPLPSQEIYWTELEKLRQETYIRIIVGEKPIDYFDTFVTDWYAKGGQQVTDEANEWWNNR